MWVKTDKDGYTEIVTGRQLLVQPNRHANTYKVVVRQPDRVSVLAVLKDGYTSLEEAQSALDSIMDDAVELPEPKAVEDDETVDGEVK